MKDKVKCWDCAKLGKCQKLKPCQDFIPYQYRQQTYTIKEIGEKIGFYERKMYRYLKKPDTLLSLIKEKTGLDLVYVCRGGDEKHHFLEKSKFNAIQDLGD